MFIKNLTISDPWEEIRNIEFKAGLNLIIDSTPTTESQLTGNNVGKTTVLKLIDFCLGGKPSIIYTDTENKKDEYKLVKDFLVDEEILITLTLVENLYEPNSTKIVIQRDFLSGKRAVRKINGKQVLEKDFENELLQNIIPDQKAEKPTFRQIISHNIRYRDESINNTLKTLNKYTSEVEYETLYLFLLECPFKEGDQKQALLAKIKEEYTFKSRLEKKETKTGSEIALDLIENDILKLNKKKSNLNLNESFEQDLQNLNSIKYQINKSSSLISKMKIRKELIEDAKKELEENISFIDLKQLESLYLEATMNVSGIQKTFSDLVHYHNNMLVEKARFISSELPDLITEIIEEEGRLSSLLKEEKALSEKVAKGDSFEELEEIISELNEKYRVKGEYENIISQLNEVEYNISKLNDKIENIDKILFSDDFENRLKTQIKKFNKYFSSISQELYGEKYALKYDRITNKNNQQVYKFDVFDAFNPNISSGKKQGEILCFDLAYTLFADEERISCLHFLLNDKKELLHGNQLKHVSEFIGDKNIQLIISILKDKLPSGIAENSHVAVELSQEEKLFKIENYYKDYNF